MPNAKIRTCLWYDTGALVAARFYCALLPGSAMGAVSHMDNWPYTVEFLLAGTPYLGLNGGPIHRPSDAASILVMSDTQAETDRLWAALAEGGTPGQGGWLKDAWGISWQIVPAALPRLIAADPVGTTAALMDMDRIDHDRLEIAVRSAQEA